MPQTIPAAQVFSTNNPAITAAFVQEFHRGFEIACAQHMSQFESRVTNRGRIVGSSFTINDMGIVEMVDRTFAERFSDTVWSLPDAGTRIAFMVDSDLYIPIEPMDLPKLLAEPQGAYRQLMVEAANRKKDRVIYNAMLDGITRKTVAADGTQGTSTKALDPSQQFFANGGNAAGAKPITKRDLTLIRALMRKNEADNEEVYMTYNSDMMTTILNDTTLTSADFMAVGMLQDGEIGKKWLGINWVPYEGLRTDATNGYQTAVAWTKSAVHFGVGKDMTVDIGPRRDKRNTIQLSAQTSYGAGRANEKKVIALNFKGA